MSIGTDYGALLTERMRAWPVDVSGFERGSISVRLLSDAQASACKISAYKRIEEQCKEAGVSLRGLLDVDSEVFDRERIRQIIHLAFVNSETVTDDFDDAAPALQMSMVRDLDTVTVDELYDVYLAYQNAKSMVIDINPDHVEELIVSLQLPGSEAALAVLDESALRVLVTAMARRKTDG